MGKSLGILDSSAVRFFLTIPILTSIVFSLLMGLSILASKDIRNLKETLIPPKTQLLVESLYDQVNQLRIDLNKFNSINYSWIDFRIEDNFIRFFISKSGEIGLTSNVNSPRIDVKKRRALNIESANAWLENPIFSIHMIRYVSQQLSMHDVVKNFPQLKNFLIGSEEKTTIIYMIEEELINNKATITNITANISVPSRYKDFQEKDNFIVSIVHDGTSCFALEDLSFLPDFIREKLQNELPYISLSIVES